MNRVSIRWAAVAALAVLTLACSNPAENAPDAEVADAKDVPEASVDAVTLPIALDQSKIEFVGSKVTGSHDGGFESFDGEISLVGDDPTLSTVRITIDATSLWSDNDRLTGHLKSPDFFEVETYPTATFTSTSIVPAEGGGYTVTGNLDLHGVEKSITFPATITMDGDTVNAKAEFSVKRFDFGIVYPGKPDDLIRDEVLVRFDITADQGGSMDEAGAETASAEG